MSPYYRFGYQARRYAYAPHGGPGGILTGTRAAETRGLGTLDGPTIGDYDLLESIGPGMAYPALSDWPLLRPAGPEPLDPGEQGRGRSRAVGAFEDVPGGTVTVLVAAAVGWMLLRKKK